MSRRNLDAPHGRPLRTQGPFALGLLVNGEAGTLRNQSPEAVTEAIAEVLREAGHTVTARTVRGEEIAHALDAFARDETIDALIVGGGDGTVSSAAGKLAGGRIAMGVFPLGTMNLFARTLGVPLDQADAAAALASAHIGEVDVCDINGAYFVHSVTLGLHTRVLAIREKMTYGSRLGKLYAGLKAWMLSIRGAKPLSVKIEMPGTTVRERGSAFVISNNALAAGFGRLPYTEDPAGGKLGVYIYKGLDRFDLVQLSASVSLGTWSENANLDSWLTGNVTIDLHRSRVKASVDGELMTLHTPLKATLHPRALRVLRPTAEANGPGVQVAENEAANGAASTTSTEL